ncbi:MAG TPA: helix-turn-helix transcriptional regulator [Kofleriaceae bacterium]|jgi:transcriptional regulator with XRE-family HTH domain|nr:helix-turn-helix transcriptional regulator [Kofleriaceae bacterium]
MVRGAAHVAQVRRQLGSRIRALRDALDLTQEVIADRIELSAKYVSQLECGQRSPSLATVVALAHDGFGITLASLMFGIDEELEAEMKELSDALAGWPKEARRALLQLIMLVLRGGAGQLPGAGQVRADVDRPRRRGESPGSLPEARTQPRR